MTEVLINAAAGHVMRSRELRKITRPQQRKQQRINPDYCVCGTSQPPPLGLKTVRVAQQFKSDTGGRKAQATSRVCCASRRRHGEHIEIADRLPAGFDGGFSVIVVLSNERDEKGSGLLTTQFTTSGRNLEGAAGVGADPQAHEIQYAGGMLSI